MKIMHTLVVMSMALSLSVAHAGEREPKIASNTSGISDSEFISNIAGASVGMGAKEPLSISASRNGGSRQDCRTAGTDRCNGGICLLS